MTVDKEAIIQIVLEESGKLAEADGAKQLLLADLEDIAGMISAAANAWLFTDLQKYNFVSAEKKIRVPLPSYEFFTIFGTYDLVLEEAETGERIMLDWKTATDASSKMTLDRYRFSWQRKIYQWMTKVPNFTYRLVEKPEAAEPTDGLAVREVSFPKIEDWDAHDKLVETYLDQATAAYRQMTSWTAPWLMRSPAGCYAYGRPCPRMGTCQAHGGIAPLVAIQPHQELEINNSGIEGFWLCPERYRQNLLIGHNAEQSRDTLMGRVFHHAMEKIYIRAFEACDRRVMKEAV